MSKSRIHIDSLSLHLPHSARGFERVIAGQIGREILTGVAEVTRGRIGAKKVDSLTTNVTTKDLRGVSGQVSRVVAGEIAKRFDNGGRE